MFTLQGRTCIFAGASGGDGIESAKALCAEGMNVVMITHQLQQAQSLLDEINAQHYPGKCAAYMDGNCYNPPRTDAEVYQEIAEKFGSIDVVISNTGAPEHEDSIDTLTKEELLEEVDHLVGGSYGMLRNALPFLRKSAAARVIFMTSTEGERGGSHESLATSVAKGAVLALTKMCAARLAGEGITVNCIAKGAIDKPMPPLFPNEKARKDPQERLPQIPAGRVGQPADVAQAICYLASEETGYVTGTVLEVSGGLNVR